MNNVKDNALMFQFIFNVMYEHVDPWKLVVHYRSLY